MIELDIALPEKEEFAGFGIDGPEDYKQAQWLAIKLRSQWRYDHSSKVWHGWNGVRWRPDSRGAIEHTVAKLAAMAAVSPASEIERKMMLKLLTVAGVAKALEALSTFPEYSTDGADWDQDPMLLGCKNGTVNLSTNTLESHPLPTSLVTKTTGHDFVPCSGPLEFVERAPDFMRFMYQITTKADGEKDPSMVLFLLTWFGASLFGFAPEQSFLLMTGIGRNGKGALKHTVLKAAGDYGMQHDANLYSRSKMGPVSTSGARADLMKLKGKRITFFSEPDRHEFNEEMLKAHTGGDIITARDLYMKSTEMVSWTPTHSITFLVNDAPSIEDVGPSMSARVMVADFQQRYEGVNEDKTLYGYAAAKLDKEAPGVLAILCWAAKRWYDSWSTGQGGVERPDRVTQQSKHFVEQNDPVAQAINEAFERDPDASTPSQLLYDAYAQWHARTDREGEALSIVKFCHVLEKKGYRRVKGRDSNRWLGLKPLSAWKMADRATQDDEDGA